MLLRVDEQDAIVSKVNITSVPDFFKSFFRLAFFVPYAIPGIIAALLWGFLYDPQLMADPYQLRRLLAWDSSSRNLRASHCPGA